MLFAVLEHPGLVHKYTYHEVTEYQIWFPFVKGLVGYNILLNDKSLIPKSLACHLISILQVSNVHTPKLCALIGITHHLSTATYYELALYKISIGNQYGNSRKLLQPP